jgi:DNA (cytosine-5)-methyltransferase 1
MAPWILYCSDDNDKILKPKTDKSVIDSKFKVVENICPLTGTSFNKRGEFWNYIKSSNLDPTNMDYDRTCENVSDNVNKLLGIEDKGWLMEHYFAVTCEKKALEDLVGRINLELYISLLKLLRSKSKSKPNKTIMKESIMKESIKEETIKYIDLFCGIGSFHNSFRKKGWECIMASDIDETTHEVYEHNYNIKPFGDIYKIDEKSIPKYDILCAGFPCQAFSQAGKHNGLSDKRGILFQEILRFALYHKPKVLALENVAALLKHDKGNTFKIISDSIKDLGYNINYKILKCSDYGIPQMRKRLIIVCIRNDIHHDVDIFDLSKYEKNVSLKDYLGKNFDKKCAYTIRCGGKGSPINDRHNWDGYWVDGEEYRLTINDAKKLQGFDDSFIMATKPNDAWRHLGNTIPTIFTEIIADKIEEII